MNDSHSRQKLYAGIGSRAAGMDKQDSATAIAMYLDFRNWTLRSGGAEGMDTAFYDGSSQSEIFRPQHATLKAVGYASQFHPAWNKCSDYAKKLHGRNSQIILGEQLDEPVLFVVYWSFDKNRGGTKMGLSIAEANKIPIYSTDDWERLRNDIASGIYYA